MTTLNSYSTHLQWEKAGKWWAAILLICAASWTGSAGGGIEQVLLATFLSIVSLGFVTLASARRLPSHAEIFQFAVPILILGYCSDPSLALWKVPNSIASVFLLSRLASALFMFLVFCVFAGSYATRQRGLSWIETLGVVSLPYLFGWLLLLLSPDFHNSVCAHLASFVSPGLATSLIVRLVVIIPFNFIVVSLLTGIAGRNYFPSARLCLLLVASAAYVSLTPNLADLPAYLSLSLHTESASPIIGSVLAILGAMLAQGGLWGQTYLITGFTMDALQGRRPILALGRIHFLQGIGKGAVYGGLFIGVLHLVSLSSSWLFSFFHLSPIASGLVVGSLAFPFLKTIIESFDGSAPFVRRVANNYRQLANYPRGAILGLGVALFFHNEAQNAAPSTRAAAGFLIGSLAYSGVHVLRDLLDILKKRRTQLQQLRVYSIEVALGGLTGAALGWYAEGSQLAVILAKFVSYTKVAVSSPEPYMIYPLFSKWGQFDLGLSTGGTRLFFNESVSGVIGWSLAAWLFSINLVALTALLRWDLRPVRDFFSASGFARVIVETLRVERWGLWMAPIIYSFLRMAADPTWYNQDGAIRTGTATLMCLVQDTSSFQQWSLWVFTNMLAYDWLRVLIWVDHMGLRVATLVNFSFVGMDVLDEKTARAIGHSASTRTIPEGLRRFATWMPLLIPFYIPRGSDWDTAWKSAEQIALQNQSSALSATAWLCGIFVIGGIVFGALKLKDAKRKYISSWTANAYRLSNHRYTLKLDSSGRGWSRVLRKSAMREEIDLTRRPNTPYALSGRPFYIVDMPEDKNAKHRCWSLQSSPFSVQGANYRCTRSVSGELRFLCHYNSIHAEARVGVDKFHSIENWSVILKNHGQKQRCLRLISYRDLVLNHPSPAERHSAFNDIHISTCFVPELQAILAANRLVLNEDRRPSREVYFHAVGPLPSGAELLGYEDSRRALFGNGSVRAPQGLLHSPRPLSDDGILYPFDPAASLWVQLVLDPGECISLSFADGWARDPQRAASLLKNSLGLPSISNSVLPRVQNKRRVLHSHSQTRKLQKRPWSYCAEGDELLIEGSTGRIWSHPIANEGGYGLVANNEGAVFSFCGNAQQNAITPFVLNEDSGITPGQMWHIWDRELDEPLLRLPLRLEREPLDAGSKNFRTTFGEGYVCWMASRENLEFEMTAFVTPDLPVEGRIIRLKNSSASKTQQLRLCGCLQFSLAEIPGDTRGALKLRWDKGDEIFLIEHDKHPFRRGPIFVACSDKLSAVETSLAKFIGRKGSASRPAFVRSVQSDLKALEAGIPAAGFSLEIDLLPGEEKTICVLIGQAEDEAEARALATRLRTQSEMTQAFERTKDWWDNFLSVLNVETEDPDFDRLVNRWLPYQLVSSRLWGRAGPYQRSGAFGFRDQLQDAMPLALVHPELCRKQILLHAAQQFIEGDTLQWWHTTWEGKTGLGARNKASDVMLWLPYVVLHYIKATGDAQILEENVTFLEGLPIPPDQDGICFAPRVSLEETSLYNHCTRAIDLVLDRMGSHGLPLMGSCDWNDGLDAVGREGDGESVWLGFFLYGVLVDFADFVKEEEGRHVQSRLLKAAEDLKSSLDLMWREDRFVRAITDKQEELVYDDALSSSWPILSGVSDIARSRILLESGLSALELEQMVLLLSPAFNSQSKPYPGRIAIYPPGIRENGGQYSHGSSWLVDAALKLADMEDAGGNTQAAQAWRKRAGMLWRKISPLAHIGEREWMKYGLEPHQQPADIYYGPGYEGRGGWSWYTGSAGRMLSAAWSLLGIEVHNGEIKVLEQSARGDAWPKLRRVTYRDKVYSSNL